MEFAPKTCRDFGFSPPAMYWFWGRERALGRLGSQISLIERPAIGDPVPAETDELIQSTTISTSSLTSRVFRASLVLMMPGKQGVVTHWQRR